jgi:hypothetical protein
VAKENRKVPRLVKEGTTNIKVRVVLFRSKEKPSGGEVMLILEKGEAEKVKKLLTETSYVAPKIEERDPYPADCWLNWKGNKLEIGYTFGGGEDNGEWANAIAQQIVNRFKAKRGGWDSVGYCKTLEEYKACCEPFHAQLRMSDSILPIKVMDTISGRRARWKKGKEVYTQAAAALFEEPNG